MKEIRLRSGLAVNLHFNWLVLGFSIDKQAELKGPGLAQAPRPSIDEMPSASRRRIPPLRTRQAAHLPSCQHSRSLAVFRRGMFMAFELQRGVFDAESLRQQRLQMIGLELRFVHGGIRRQDNVRRHSW